jgi:MFS family permease
MLVGAQLLPRLPLAGFELPFARTLPPWKLLFIIVGVPGLLLVPIVLTIREPVRREAGNTKTVALRCSLAEFLRYVARHRATFFCFLASSAGIGIVGYANLAWAPAFFERRFGIGVSSSGLILGFILAIAGLGGAVVGGILSDRWVQQRDKAARLRVMAYAWIVILPASLTWTLVPNAAISYTLLAVALFGASLGQSAGPVSIQDIVPNRMRGQAIAGFLLISGLLSLGLGPSAPALLNDLLFHDDNALGFSLSLVALLVGLVGPLAAWYGLRPYARSWDSVYGAANLPR